MRWLFLSITLALLLSLGCAAVSAQPQPAVMVTSYEVHPKVLMPGDEGVLTVTIKNTAAGPITENMAVYTMVAHIKSVSVAGNGIRVLSGPYTDVGSLGPGGTVTFTFSIKARHSVGMHTLTFRADLENAADINYPILIRVDNSRVKIVALDIPRSPVVGRTYEVKLSIINTNLNKIDDVRIVPRGDNVSFAPPELFIGGMTPGEIKEVKFRFTSRISGRENLVFRVEYKNWTNLHSDALVVPVDVAEGLGAELILTRVEVKSRGMGEYTISGEVANVGGENLKSVTITVEEGENVRPLHPRVTAFVGTLRVDDFGSFELDAWAAEGVTRIPLIIRFIDANDNPRSVTQYVSVEHPPAEEPGTPAWAIAVVAIVAFIVIALIVRSWKRRS